jgi:SAM-dependent methyltransferase
MDLRSFNLNEKQISKITGEGFYQPFILTDNIQTGIGYSWQTGDMTLGLDKGRRTCFQWDGSTNPLKISGDSYSDDKWNIFIEANQRLRNMYDSWISSIYSSLNSVDGCTVVDVASNAGYFLYRLAQYGAIDGTGYDLLDLKDMYQVFNEAMGLNMKFFNKPYDMNIHTIPGIEKADIVISSAIMCHLSDPTYYLSFLGSITKKLLFLFSTIDDDMSYTIRYEGAKFYYPNNPFPICFDQMTHVSKGIIEFALKDMGFKEIIELPYQEEWVSYNWYKNYKAIIAIK